MKRKHVLFLSSCLLLLALICAVSFTVERWYVGTPELFGDGSAYFIRSTDHIYGVIFAWGVYGLHGVPDDCRITPLYSEVGDAHVVACRMVFNKKDTFFKGWIDFRGHPRPYCGARRLDNLNGLCYKDESVIVEHK